MDSYQQRLRERINAADRASAETPPGLDEEVERELTDAEQAAIDGLLERAWRVYVQDSETELTACSRNRALERGAEWWLAKRPDSKRFHVHVSCDDTREAATVLFENGSRVGKVTVSRPGSIRSFLE